MMRDVDPSNTGSFDQNSLISLIARKGKSTETLEEMIEAIKRFAEVSGDGNSKEEKDLKIKISVDSLKYPLKSNGEIMLEH